MDTSSRACAESLDQKDALRHTRDEFVIPTKQEVTSKTLAKKGLSQLKSDDTLHPHSPSFIHHQQ